MSLFEYTHEADLSLRAELGLVQEEGPHSVRSQLNKLIRELEGNVAEKLWCKIKVTSCVHDVKNALDS